MADATYGERLQARSGRALLDISDVDLETRFKALADRFGAIAGPGDIGPFGPLAVSGRDKLRKNLAVTAEEQAAVELAIRLSRPAPLVRAGVPEALSSEALRTFPSWAHFRDVARSITGAVGRIDSVRLGQQVGTGFLVAANLVVTNRHVLNLLSFGAMALSEGQAEILFGVEPGAAPARIPILRVVAVHQDADICLLEIRPSGDRPVLSFGAGPKVGDQVAAIGFPIQDSVRNWLFVPEVFGDLFGVQRAAPGEIIELAPGMIFHDASTLGGCSGSPIVSLDTGKVVGVHAEGNFLFNNRAVDAATVTAFLTVHGV